MQACNAYMLVIDRLLMPVADLHTLPTMTGTQAFNVSMWQEVEQLVQAAVAANDTAWTDIDFDTNTDAAVNGSANSSTAAPAASVDSSNNLTYRSSDPQSSSLAASSPPQFDSGSSGSSTVVLAAAAASVVAAAVATIGLFVAIRRRNAALKRQGAKLATTDEDTGGAA